MAIEGPLRELGIHDVFQLLDLSRKTGMLRVSSGLRDNEGTVWFESGHVIAASIRSNPHPIGARLQRAGKIGEADLERARAMQERGDDRRLGEILVAIGALSRRELDRQVRLQIEAVVFELMSWEEGFFSFVEAEMQGLLADAVARISTESLLMEGARRLDEWTRIAHRIPSVAVVPVLAASDGEGAARLDLLPHEWEVLAAVDGEADLRIIAQVLGRSEFEVAKVAYGLLATGVISIREPSDARHGPVDIAPATAMTPLLRARSAALQGRFDDAVAAWRTFLAEEPADIRAPRVRELVACAARLQELLVIVHDHAPAGELAALGARATTTV
jgi:hypothetical protein